MGFPNSNIYKVPNLLAWRRIITYISSHYPMEAYYLLGLLYVLTLIYTIWITLDNVDITRNILLVFNHVMIRKLLTREAVNLGLIGATTSVIVLIFLHYPILYIPHITCLGLSAICLAYSYKQVRPILRICSTCGEDSGEKDNISLKDR